MPEEFFVRKGRIADRQQVFKIWKASMDFHAGLTDIDYDMVENAPEIFMSFYDKNVRSRKMLALVAERDCMIIGYLLGMLQPRPPIFKTKVQAFINDLAVDSEYRQLGVGKALLAEFHEWAKYKGATYSSLFVLAENENAIDFYDRVGYRTIMHIQRKDLK